MKICPSCKSEFGGGEVFCPNDGARLINHSQYGSTQVNREPGADPMVGTVLNERYRILRQIGEGGMGLVYEAEHVTIEKRVALKILRDDFSGRPEVVERFKQEARSATKIGNAHIVDISDFGVTPNGASYFAMELLEGEDLANVLQRDGYVPIARAADIILQCCQALGAAHAKGIVHRDMKPENIFLTYRDGRSDFVKIVDFGIAKMSDIETPGAPGRKLTKTGMIFGTPEYMSPEQAAGKPLDHRVDIYGLAVIFYEMITGRVPFVGDTFMGILTQHMFEDPPRLEEVNPHVPVPDAITSFIFRGLAKDPDDRFQTCEEMSGALDGALAGRLSGSTTYSGYAEPIAARARSARSINATTVSGELPMPGRKRSSSLGLVIGALVVVIAAAAGGATVWYFGSQGAAHDATVRTHVPANGADAGGLLIAEGPRDDDGGAAQGVDPVDAGPAMVNVDLRTDPGGAHVWVVGRGEVCTMTPCSFQTLAGQRITVRARSGRREGEAEITPTSDTVMQLAMHRTGGGGGGGPRKQGGSSGGSGGSGSGDLKIPDIFRPR